MNNGLKIELGGIVHCCPEQRIELASLIFASVFARMDSLGIKVSVVFDKLHHPLHHSMLRFLEAPEFIDDHCRVEYTPFKR